MEKFGKNAKEALRVFNLNRKYKYGKVGIMIKVLKKRGGTEDARAQGRKGLVLTCKDKLIPYYSKFGFELEGVSESVHGNVVWNQMRLTFPG